MITVFNRAILCREPSVEAAAKAWSALRKEKIPYEIKTRVSGAEKLAVRVPVYIKKKDLAKVKELCEIG